MTRPLARRQALAGTAAVGIAVPLLAACGSDDPGTATDAGGSTSAPAGGAAPGDTLTTVSEVPEGSGIILNDAQLVVTQPEKGVFKCFTAVCTHQGCIVSSVQLGGIRCECHGSAFSIEDGSVVNPPATQPLAEKAITVDGSTITLA